MNRLEEKRLDAGLSRSQLAEKIGCDPQSLYRWEKGKRSPDSRILIALADVFGCSVDELLGRAFSTNPTQIRDRLHA